MGLGKTGDEAQDPLVGKIIGGCLLKKRIGRGGMGSVYLASREADHQSVAVKILAPFMAEYPAIVTRFTREVRAASRVRNPNVIRVLGSSEEDGIHFSVMEYIDGETLADLLKREGQLSIGRAAFIAREVARGLAALHAEGIIHRDIKPSNILISRDGCVKLTDFGIARDVYELQRLTAPGDLLGTLGFAAPEQLESSDGDARADLYSLGATLHFMLSGLRPPTSPRTSFLPLGGGVPQALRDLVGSLLALDPAARPADAKTVAAALFPHCTIPLRRSFRKKCLRLTLKLAGGILVFWAGALATSSHGLNFHADPWTLVFPVPGSILPSAALFGVGVLMAFFALIRGRDKMGLGLRSIVGLSFLAGSLVVAYMAGAAIGTLTLQEAALAVVSCSPEVLFAESLALAALGLFVVMRKPGKFFARAMGATIVLAALATAATASSAGSAAQAVEDLRSAMSHGAWAWTSFILAAAGMILAYRHDRRLWQLLLAPIAVFVSLGLVYWASLGKGSPPLQDALTAPGGGIVLAILLAFAARVVLDLGSGSSERRLNGGASVESPTTTTPTPST